MFVAVFGAFDFTAAAEDGTTNLAVGHMKEKWCREKSRSATCF